MKPENINKIAEINPICQRTGEAESEILAIELVG
jgi:hypothetical protein